MSGWAWMGKELWCATLVSSEKVTQLRKVPYGEYCFGRQDGEHVRISGACTISIDGQDKIKLYDAVPILKDYIDDPGYPEYVVIRMKPDRIRLYGMSDLAYQEFPLA
jgi:general stress protein 26